MSRVTSIIGWVETDGYEKVHNDKVLKELEHNEDFIKMFSSPEETGTKNPDYVLFGASINHCNFESWLEKFEDFIKKLRAFGAFVFVETESGGDRAFVIGYHLKDGEFIKHGIDFGDPCDYFLERGDSIVDFKFPLLFRILKILQTRRYKMENEDNVMVSKARIDRLMNAAQLALAELLDSELYSLGIKKELFKQKMEHVFDELKKELKGSE